MTSDERAKATAQLLADSLAIPQPGEVYRHYKGGVYSIIARAVREDTLEPVVIYHSNLKNANWERTLTNFNEMVTVDGQTMPRFARVSQ